jgi:hypothetical protein
MKKKSHDWELGTFSNNEDMQHSFRNRAKEKEKKQNGYDMKSIHHLEEERTTTTKKKEYNVYFSSLL